MGDSRERLRLFVRQYLHNDRIQDGDDFFADCGANSMFAMQLVLYIENEFDIEVDHDDLEIDNFRTIDAVDQLVTRKRQSAPV
jgi:methoxymalonate biosynthesis acyl carrier protein